MSVWQFGACVDGYNRKQGGDQVAPPSPEEFDAMLEDYAEIIAAGARGI